MLPRLIKLICLNSPSFFLLISIVLHQLQGLIELLFLLVENLTVVAVRVLFSAGVEDRILLIDPPETLFDVLLYCM